MQHIGREDAGRDPRQPTLRATVRRKTEIHSWLSVQCVRGTYNITGWDTFGVMGCVMCAWGGSLGDRVVPCTMLQRRTVLVACGVVRRVARQMDWPVGIGLIAWTGVGWDARVGGKKGEMRRAAYALLRRKRRLMALHFDKAESGRGGISCAYSRWCSCRTSMLPAGFSSIKSETASRRTPPGEERDATEPIIHSCCSASRIHCRHLRSIGAVAVCRDAALGEECPGEEVEA